MGSKMAAASRVVEAVKPHTPLIKFPDRKNSPKLNVTDALQSMASPPPAASPPRHPAGGRPPGLPISRGPPDTAEIVKTLPQKYRRKLMSPEEMEFITRGGPE
ncbi:28S ribosomal protein S36, mitochondrial [Tachyglossus aculeatus]|uniref:28S ribosomal protein S36, mitochondrial n=1 Tax=Tachyglossus aculeatus TaxID=9261 RepID=UPI0018F5E95A|nr:28S ribosomal protein S36, mitochondrial [Tachyglossus aculeatus]